MPKQCRFGAADQPPDLKDCEIRLFLASPSIDADLLQTLTACFEAGVERAFVLIDSTTNQAATIPDSYASVVHVFARQDKVAGFALRNLLHRYGVSHWCVLGRLGEEIADSTGSTSNLGDLCAQLDTDGYAVQEAASHDVEPIELTARDVRTNAVFRGTARVAQPGFSYELPVFVSRVVLVKYAGHVLLDADATLCGNVRKSPLCLRLNSLHRRDAP